MAAPDLWWARRQAEQAWQQHLLAGDASGVRTEVSRSWDRSARRVERTRQVAPLVADDDTRERWRESPLRHAVETLTADLQQVVVDGDFIAAVTEADGTILWTDGSTWMRNRAAAVHFVPGGRWDEASMGTNALALSLRSNQAAEVFSAEHYSQAVHDWVCYSAPITARRSGRLLGIIDLSTTWDRAKPLGLSAARLLASNLSLLIPDGAAPTTSPGLVLRTLGGSSVHLDERDVALPPRQIEILAVLSLHPEGLSLDGLHTALYPDLRVKPATVKAELSHLRRALGDVIASRPYRLTVPVAADHLAVLDHVGAGRLHQAVECFAGPLLPASEAPLLREHGRYLEEALRRAVVASGDPDLLFALGSRLPFDVELHERTIRSLGPGDPRSAIAFARVSAAER